MNTPEPASEEVVVNHEQLYVPIPPDGFGEKVQVVDREPQPVSKLHILGPLAIYILLLITYTSLACVYGFMGMSDQDFQILVTIEIIFIPITAILDGWLRTVSEQRRSLGFFKISNELRRMLLIPTYILINVFGFLLLRICWGTEFDEGVKTKVDIPSYFFSAILLAQCLGILGVLIALYTKVAKHNASQLLPDYYYFVVEKQDEDYVDNRQVGVGLGANSGIGVGVGVNSEIKISEGMSDVIEYLSRHNRRLCKEVARLRTALDSNAFWDPKYVQDLNEMKNSLEAAHQRVRLLESEKEHMSERFTGTMDILQEREAEILKLKQSRVQFVEEYQRLRESLEEWSNRNAKLERKYNSLQQQRKEDQDRIQDLEQKLELLQQQQSQSQLQFQQQQSQQVLDQEIYQNTQQQEEQEQGQAQEQGQELKLMQE